jgi:hypothetical protein
MDYWRWYFDTSCFKSLNLINKYSTSTKHPFKQSKSKILLLFYTYKTSSGWIISVVHRFKYLKDIKFRHSHFHFTYYTNLSILQSTAIANKDWFFKKYKKVRANSRSKLKFICIKLNDISKTYNAIVKPQKSKFCVWLCLEVIFRLQTWLIKSYFR